MSVATEDHAVNDWRHDAACADSRIDTERFFPERGESVDLALRVCARCPVRKPCLEFALDINERIGVWGGTSERQRRRLRRRGA